MHMNVQKDNSQNAAPNNPKRYVMDSSFLPQVAE
jgi:hypothetical protein